MFLKVLSTYFKTDVDRTEDIDSNEAIEYTNTNKESFASFLDRFIDCGLGSDVYCNEGGLVLCDVGLAYNHKFDKYQKNRLLRAVDNQMSDNIINSWVDDCQKPRMKLLTKLKQGLM